MGRLRLVDKGRHGADCISESTERAAPGNRIGSDTAGMESTNSSTSAGVDVKIGTGVKAFVSAYVVFVSVRSLLNIKAVMP